MRIHGTASKPGIVAAARYYVRSLFTPRMHIGELGFDESYTDITQHVLLVISKIIKRRSLQNAYFYDRAISHNSSTRPCNIATKNDTVRLY